MPTIYFVIHELAYPYLHSCEKKIFIFMIDPWVKSDLKLVAQGYIGKLVS